MSPCETCDFIGPELPSVVRDARDLHRGWHRLLPDALVVPLDGWQVRVLDRVMEARAKGLRLGTALPRRRWLR